MTEKTGIEQAVYMAASNSKGVSVPVSPITSEAQEALLREVAVGIVQASGDDFFAALVQSLARALDVAVVFIGEITGPDENRAMQTVAVCVDGTFAPNFRYELAGAPCKGQSRVCGCEHNAQCLVSANSHLGGRGAAESCAISLCSNKGEALGVLALMHDKPFPGLEVAKSLLKTTAARASAELERRRTESALRHSEQLIRNILEALPVGIWVTDRSGNICVGNPAGQQIWAGARFVGIEQYGEYKGWWAESGERISAHEWALARALRTGESSINEVIDIECFDGARKTILNSAMALSNENGEIICAIGVNEDVTEHRRAEHALRRSEARLAQAQHIARLGHWEWDIVRNELSWSEELYRIFGLGSQEFGATHEAFLNQVHPDDREMIQSAVNGALHERQPYSLDHRIMLPDGTVRIIHEEAVVTFDSEGWPARMFGTAQDITEQKRAEEALRISEKQYRDLMEQASDAIFIADNSGSLVAVNARGCELIGYEERELLGMNLSDLIPAKFLSQLLHLGTILFEHQVLRKDGIRVDLEINAKLLEDGRVQGIARDVTARKADEAEMLKLSLAVQQTADSVVICDSSGIIEYVNSAFERTTGYSKEEAIGRYPRILKSSVHAAGFYKRLWVTITTGETFREVFVNRKKNGELYYEEKTITPIKDRSGRINNYVSTGKDITDRMQAQERLQFLAHHDPLTRLPNRVLFLDRLEHVLARGQRTRRSVAILFLDLDRFKNINDTLGHNIGDLLLQAMGERLSACVREGDMVARLGGDEFAVLIQDVMQIEDLKAIAQKILNEFSLPFVIDMRELFISTSMGISICPRDGTNSLTLLKNADAAMYRAKDLGRNNFQFYSAEMSAMALERLTLETGLRRALERNEFVLHYQPQVDARSGRVSGVEALLRWQHPEFGLLLPAQFLPVAEDTGMIALIDEWVAKTACREVRTWQQRELGSVRVAINLSGRRFSDPTFTDFVRQLLNETGLDPSLLEIEIPEGVIMKNAEAIIDRLRDIHAMGIQFAIDDFGTGYSSLSYLRRFPISSLKIDKSFIHYVPGNPDDAEIVKTVIAMAHSLKLRVVAEGAETADQVDFLREQGCDVLQGFFFSGPLSAEQVPLMLETLHKRLA